jgi:glycosyltransferase involved in cell wall biosynthesis
MGMNNIWAKIIKGLGSSLGVTIIGGLITTLFGLQVEYTAYQGNQSNKETVIIDTIHVLHEEKIENQNASTIKTQREIRLVADEFAYKKHKWYIRLFGGMIILFPFFYFPLFEYYKQKKLELKIMFRHAYDNTIGETMAKKAWASYLQDYLITYLIFLALYYVVILLLSKYGDIQVCSYGTLIVERILNKFVGWF